VGVLPLTFLINQDGLAKSIGVVVEL